VRSIRPIAAFVNAGIIGKIVIINAEVGL